MASQQQIAPCLWFDGKAEEAAAFYVSVFADSSIDRVTRSDVDWPGGKAGDAILVEFTIAGQRYQALNGGQHDSFNEAISLSVNCKDQAEVDRFWQALTSGGGKPVQCGWLKDKFGVSWQIVPDVLPQMLNDEDPQKAKRVMEAMMQMVKLDVETLQRASAGNED